MMKGIYLRSLFIRLWDDGVLMEESGAVVQITLDFMKRRGFGSRVNADALKWLHQVVPTHIWKFKSATGLGQLNYVSSELRPGITQR